MGAGYDAMPAGHDVMGTGQEIPAYAGMTGGGRERARPVPLTRNTRTSFPHLTSFRATPPRHPHTTHAIPYNTPTLFPLPHHVIPA